MSVLEKTVERKAPRNPSGLYLRTAYVRSTLLFINWSENRRLRR
jgi:hypothetical protein